MGHNVRLARGDARRSPHFIKRGHTSPLGGKIPYPPKCRGVARAIGRARHDEEGKGSKLGSIFFAFIPHSVRAQATPAVTSEEDMRGENTTDDSALGRLFCFKKHFPFSFRPLSSPPRRVASPPHWLERRTHQQPATGQRCISPWLKLPSPRLLFFLAYSLGHCAHDNGRATSARVDSVLFP